MSKVSSIFKYDLISIISLKLYLTRSFVDRIVAVDKRNVFLGYTFNPSVAELFVSIFCSFKAGITNTIPSFK